ncbi:hypothetical protein N0V95_008939 [Ascochyta clinopodiicola]|nr:hypothetical protein N0V95_008939 [Ascochyta clinopodiicola]
MPVQHTIFGRPVRLQMPPRRFQALLAVVLIIVVTLTLNGPPSTADLPTYESVAEHVKNPHLPDVGGLPAVPNPFGPSVHKPPKPAVQPAVQPNSTVASSYGTLEWLTDFKWRNPFSSTITLDENTALLPPLQQRPPIYTYYNARKKQDAAVAAAENRLVLAWRRAWWAQGFRPVVLSRAEAMQHPQYPLFQRMKLDSRVEVEVMRWLAWANMGGGILANSLALPMAAYENPMLSFLRRQEYPQLSRVDGLNSGVFFGDQAAVDGAIKKLVNSQLLKNATANMDKIAATATKDGGAVVSLLAPADIAKDTKANGIAYYSTDVISKSYKTIADKLTNTTQAEGLTLLGSLVNAHLHLTFQELHPEGLAIAQPLPEHTTSLIEPSIDIARNLTQCPSSPMPKSCPPNRPKCVPCSSKNAPKLQLFPEFVNTTKFFTIGTVPHPYTINSLHYTRDNLDVSFLRNNAKRNLWITTLTRKSVGTDHSESYRLMQFKDLVAALSAHTLWLTAERTTKDDLDWIFGFELPTQSSTTKEPTSPSETSELILFPRPAFPQPIQGIDVPDSIWTEKEKARLTKAREAIKSKDRFMRGIVDAVEGWNLADTEAWRFSRAYSARRRVERKKWEDEEKAYVGSEKKAAAKGKGRWTDRFMH